MNATDDALISAYADGRADEAEEHAKRVQPRRPVLRDFWIAVDSGIRAGLMQFRHVRRLQRKAATLDTPF
jgi:hypothetical protein